MINKALLYIVLSFLIFGPVNAAKKVTYLKCPLMMVENKGKTYGEDWWPIGAQLNEFYVKINEGKKIKYLFINILQLKILEKIKNLMIMFFKGSCF